MAVDDGHLQPPSKDADRPVPPAPGAEEEVVGRLQPAAPNGKKKKPAKVPELPAATKSPLARKKKRPAKASAQSGAESPPPRKKKTASSETAPTAVELPAATKSPPAGKKKPASRERRTWPPDDELLILRTLVEHRRQHGDLPEKLDDALVHSVACAHLQAKGWELRAIKDKVHSLQRRYKNNSVSNTPHEEHVHRLSDEIWGGPHRAEDGSEARQRSFEEMCQLYPNIGKEVEKLADVQPAITTSLSKLDDSRARSIEEKLTKVSSIEVKIHMQLGTKVEVPKAKIRKELVNLLARVAKDV